MSWTPEEKSSLFAKVGKIEGIVEKLSCAKNTEDIEKNTAFRNQFWGVVFIIPFVISLIGAIVQAKIGG